MKVLLTKDMPSLQSTALEQLDRHMANERAKVRGLNGDIHAIKLAEVKLGVMNLSPLLTAEAKATGRDWADLATEVRAKAGDTDAKLAKLEIDRQRRQASIRKATNPAEIDTALEGIS